MEVSIIIPLYNKEAYIAECLDSVLQQDHNEFELIIIDDCSTDSSIEIVRRYNDQRIMIITNEENLGPGGCMNLAFKIAKGKFLFRMDADDIMQEGRISKQLQFMKTNPEIGISSGQIKCFGSDDNIWNYPLSNEEIQASFLFTVPICQGAACFNLELINKNNLKYGTINYFIGEDRVFWFEARKNFKFANLNEILLLYRRGEQNIAHDSRFNRLAIRNAINTYFLESLGWKCNNEEHEYLLMYQGIYSKIDKRTIKNSIAFGKKLIKLNEESKEFDQKLFNKYIIDYKNKLFYKIVSISSSLTFYYWLKVKKPSFIQFKYFISYKLFRRA